MTSLDGLNDNALHGLAEVLKRSVLVELGTVEKTTSPGEHGSDRVGGGLTTLLVNAVMSCNSAMSGLSLDGTIGGLKHGGHESEGTITLSDNIRLDITIVVLAGPDEATAGLDNVGNHIIDETMLVPKTGGLKLGFVRSLINFSKDILEATIVLLEDGVLGSQVARVVSVKSILHAGVSESNDGFVSVVHAEHDTGSLEVENFKVGWLGAIFWDEGHVELAWHLRAEISGFILITKSVSTNNNGCLPAWHKLGDVGNHDGGSKDSATNDVSNGSVGGSPHLLEAKFSDTSFVGGDSGALDTNLAGLDGFCGLDSDLIVSGITVLDAEIEVLDVQITMREDELILDELPDDSGHLISVHLDNGVSNLDLGGSGVDHLSFI